MIAITDTTVFDVETSFDALNKVPSASIINNSIQGAIFKTAQITTALRNLLISVSNSSYNVFGNTIYVPFDPNYPNRLWTLFSLVGFAKNANDGTFTFSAKPNNLAKITEYIIKDLVMFKSFKDRALHTWTQQANAIRAMQGLELERLSEIAVYNSTNEDGSKLLNNKPQDTGRFLEITTTPSMPVVSVFNYSATTIKVRVKVEFLKQNMQGGQKRRFLDYFPNEINGNVQTQTIPMGSNGQ